MGVRTQIEVTCDYSECKGGKSGPSVVQWCKELVEAGKAELPEEAKYMVLFTQNGAQKAFCCQLCAAKNFLPPGYEVKQKAVIPFPAPVQNSPVNGQEGG